MTATPPDNRINREASVAVRYSVAAQMQEPALCCPLQCRPQYLDVVPQEILERDYGCGDPTPYVREGDTVLDLGAGGGKVCYIASQVVGPSGRVIGVDCNQEMIELARSYREEVADRVGAANVEFRYGLIQDLALDLEQLAEETRGPFKKVEDDDDHVYHRGKRMAVCDKTFHLLQKEPYDDQFEFIEPHVATPIEDTARFDRTRPKHRHLRETKGQGYDATIESAGVCTDSGCC
jgi:SAM-dependent methyltransferase